MIRKGSQYHFQKNHTPCTQSKCTENWEKMSNPLKTHQITSVSHPAPKLPSASNFFDVILLISLMSRGRNISLVLISIPSLVEIFNRITRRVPHVDQELHILPEHPNFWAIKKLCSFSWTPSNYFSFSSRPKIAFRLKLFRRFKINELIDFI
jgi:hypothetical protein